MKKTSPEDEAAQRKAAREVVQNYAAQLFPDALSDVMAMLDEYGTESYEREVERVQYDVLQLCQGDFELLRHYVKAAKRDYRDVLYWEEYYDEAKLKT